MLFLRTVCATLLRMTLQELFDTPEKWTKNAFARVANGDDTIVGDPKAVCWCLAGAVNQCYPGENYNIQVRLLIAIKTLFGEMGIAEFNDRSRITFADIRKVIEKANV